MYSDKLCHVHFHLVPKYVDGPDYGDVFKMNPRAKYLSDNEYETMVDSLKKALK